MPAEKFLGYKIFLCLYMLNMANAQGMDCTNKIQSVGAHSNPDFTWAVSTDNLVFFNEYECQNNVVCSITWKYWNISASFKKGFPNSTVEKCSLSGADNNTDYGFTCNSEQNKVLTKFSILRKLGELDNGSKITWALSGDSCERTLYLQYCPKLPVNDENVDLDQPEKAGYKSIAEYSCKNSHQALIVNGKYNSSDQTYKVTCDYDAQWKGTENDVSCWFAPNSTLLINPNTTVFNGTEIFLNCSVVTGSPSIIQYFEYYQGNKNITGQTSFVVDSGYNNSTFWCRAANQYVIDVDNESGKSPEVFLNVYFPPQLVSVEGANEASLMIELGGTASLVYKFSANPIVDFEDLELHLLGYSSSNYTLLNITNASLTGSEIQTFIYTIEKVKEYDFGIYTLFVHSHEKFSNPLKISTNLTEKAHDIPTGPGSTRLGLIIGCSAAGLLIIILVCIIICIHLKRSKGSKSGNDTVSSGEANTEKEERVNPIYGSATSEKEERANPLYGTTSTDALDAMYSSVVKPKKNKGKAEKKDPMCNLANDNTVKETCVVVDKRKKRGGNTNPVFTVDTSGDTYTEVVKKKNKKQDLEPDVMYAEVSKKKTGKGTDENLHGS